MAHGLGETGTVKNEDRGSQDYKRRLEARLHPESIRATLGFAGLFQMTHELLKKAVLEDVREFYWRGFDDGRPVYNEQAYTDDVLALGTAARLGDRLGQAA